MFRCFKLIEVILSIKEMTMSPGNLSESMGLHRRRSPSGGCSPGSPGGGGVLRRALDAAAAARARRRCVRAAAFNAALLLVLAADLSSKCAGYTTILHWVELAAAGVAGANLARLALRLARRDAAAPELSPQQRRLLALPLGADKQRPAAATPDTSLSPSLGGADEPLSLSLSPGRGWRASPSPPPASPPSPAPASPDRFIADRRGLADYLQQYGERRAAGPEPPSSRSPAPQYQLSSPTPEPHAPAAPAPDVALAAVVARLHLDPQRLTQFNLNLRLWLHVTILERLVREMAAAEAALGRLGAGGSLEELAPERLRALARAPHAPPQLGQLLPFLEPFPNRRYVVRRVRELAHGPCLSEYRWSGGGAGREDADPCDAELLLQLLAAYLDAQLPAGGAGGPQPFSAAHLSSGPTPPVRGLAVHRAPGRPPHYVLALDGDTLALPRGRNNLLHTLLLFIAAAARRDPPALGRVHLGPAGLNMLWIIGR